MHAIGVDIGGTKISAAVVTATGDVLESRRAPTPARDAAAIVDIVCGFVEALRAIHEVPVVGVAAAGFVDASRSIVLRAPNINWRDEPLRERLSARLGLPVVIENDANAAGWAEHRFGAGRGVRHMTMLTIGTGVGGAVVIDGALLRGGHGMAAELGHIRLVPDGLACGCGASGCLEQYASGRALMRIADRLADEAGPDSPLAAARVDGVMDVGALTLLMRQREAGAVAALAELGTRIGEGCATIGAVLDPECFVIGGGVAVAGELLLAPAREAYRRVTPASGVHAEPEFRVAELENDAGVVGAADLARLELARR